MSPLDFFMSQAHQITIFSNPALLEECFLLRVNCKVNHDATLSIEIILYETDQNLANSRVEVRYEPEWLSNPARVLLLYRDGQKVGEAHQVNFHDNSKVKRRGPGRPSALLQQKQLNAVKDLESDSAKLPATTISFANLKDVEISKPEPQKPKAGGT
jgi:putative transposase